MPWGWAAASVVGAAHLRDGSPRQDAMRVIGVDDILVAVACDGAGSASHGALGATLATQTMARVARQWLERYRRFPEREVVETWAWLARLRLDAAARLRGMDIGHLATTLVFVISDGTNTIIAHVGDGAIVARDERGDWVALSWPEAGEHYPSTFFMTDETMRLTVVDIEFPITAVAVFTDGIERLALHFAALTAHAPFFSAVRKALTPLGVGLHKMHSHQLRHWLANDLCQRSDDDLTFIFAQRE